ncbi:MAG: hypothetical protein V3576_06300, partial [Candidatus Cloacimonadota bacterium]
MFIEKLSCGIRGKALLMAFMLIAFSLSALELRRDFASLANQYRRGQIDNVAELSAITQKSPFQPGSPCMILPVWTILEAQVVRQPG